MLTKKKAFSICFFFLKKIFLYFYNKLLITIAFFFIYGVAKKNVYVWSRESFIISHVKGTWSEKTNFHQEKKVKTLLKFVFSYDLSSFL